MNWCTMRQPQRDLMKLLNLLNIRDLLALPLLELC
jgi:hypothetical protein